MFPLFQWHACKLAKLSACIAKCMTTINNIYIFLHCTVLVRGSYRGILVLPDQLILFSVKREFRKLFSVIRDLKVFCVTREELKSLTDIRDITTLFSVILRRESSECLESSIE